MTLQTDALTMIGLGVLGDTPPNSIQPPLVDGIHLRWAFRREVGFPWHGYYLFRREHRPHRGGEPICLSHAIPKHQKPGQLSGTTLNLESFGQFNSDRNLVLTQDFLSSGALGFDLNERGFLRFELAPGRAASRVDIQLGFRWELQEDVDFRERSIGDGSNPRIEKRVQFEVRDASGPASVTWIENWNNLSGLNGLNELEITLPQKASSVELMLTSFGPSAEVIAFNEDGGVASTETTSGSADQPETLTLMGEAITRVIVWAPEQRTLLHRFSWVFPATIEAEAFSENGPVASVSLQGGSRQLVSAKLEANAITAIEFSAGPAVLIDLCLDAAVGWDQIEDFPYPLRLPVSHPDYLCSRKTEDLEETKKLAKKRIKYGDSNQFLPSPEPLSSDGAISVENGSSIVKGSGTHWTGKLSGASLQVSGDATVYTIITRRAR